MVFHKPWLQAATPALAEGPQGRELPADDLAWKHFRIQGLHIVIGTIYFEHTTKLAGPNLDRFNSAIHLTDNCRRLLILAGDYNMEPDEWDHEMLQAAGLQIMTAGIEKTCKTSHGSKLNDYIIVSTDLVPLITNLKILADVPWGPHVALTFEVNRRLGKIFHQALVRPEAITYATDEKGRTTPWHIDEEEWAACETAYVS